MMHRVIDAVVTLSIPHRKLDIHESSLPAYFLFACCPVHILNILMNTSIIMWSM